MVELDTIPGAWHLPRPNWRVLHEWIAAQLPGDAAKAAWHAVARQWLDRLASALGGEYTVTDWGSVLLLSSLDPISAADLLEAALAAKARVADLLGELGPESGLGPHVILAFDSADHYAEYSASPGEQGPIVATGGSCFTSGYVHIALPPYESRKELLLALAHEITHMLLALQHLALPLWL